MKVNGKKCDINTELIHTKHTAYTLEDIIGMNFVKICKSRIANENSLSAGQIYLEEQSKLINKLGDMELVAASIPQLINIAGGLYKHKAKFIPPRGLELKPSELTIDFEIAVMGAFRYHFPRIEINNIN
jgi:hypothetical protein